MKITRKSMLSGEYHELDINVDEEKMNLWDDPYFDRPLIQDYFPELTDSEREFIKTGITNEEWESMFNSEEP